MSIIFDSKVWIALFNENDAHHENARQLFTESSVIYVPEYVILEIPTVLQLRASKLKANIFSDYQYKLTRTHTQHNVAFYFFNFWSNTIP